MKRQPKRAKSRREAIQVYTYEQAQAVSPYITSILRSLREHLLESQSYRQRAKRIDERPGRPDRDALIALQEAEQQARRADDAAGDDLAELQTLDVYPFAPIQGLALVPFVHEQQLAWYVFDLFDAQPLRYWRFQTDPKDTRREVTPRQHGRVESAQIA